ncbi:hypothetical protein EDD15DRAFT_2519646 [Pisolithus albus]|nr:hypothetical protein EDD15DRAFT_2519646 [Pisolithus albus]
MPLECEGMAHLSPHTLEGATTHLTLLNTTRKRQGQASTSKLRLLERGMRYLGVARGARAASIESRGGRMASWRPSKAFRGEVEGTDSRPNQNHEMVANMNLDLLSSYEGEPGFEPPRNLELDMGWKTSKEELGLVAHLDCIPSYHSQEPDSEYTKVVAQGFDRVELVATSLFEDILDWFDLGVLKCYERLKTVPMPNSWGISNDEAPEQLMEGWGACNCDPIIDSSIEGSDEPRAFAVGLEGYNEGEWGRLDATSNVYGGYEVDSATENDEEMKYYSHPSLDCKSAQKTNNIRLDTSGHLEGGLDARLGSRSVWGSRRDWGSRRRWGEGSYNSTRLKNAKGGARELSCGRRGKTVACRRRTTGQNFTKLQDVVEDV